MPEELDYSQYKRLYSIYDAKLKTYDVNWESPNDDTAIRQISIAANKPGDHTLFQYPEDFALFFVGHRDPETGLTINQLTPLLVRQVQAMVDDTQSILPMTNGDTAFSTKGNGSGAVQWTKPELSLNLEPTKETTK